ncbi:MAG: CRISPR-associated endonuclease Cas2 [Candidatus Woesearchaeota archaeon]
MFLIAVYDIKEERVAKVYALMRRYLMRRQRSVFDGEITQANYTELKEKVQSLINPEEDTVIFYELRVCPDTITSFGIPKHHKDEFIIG